MNEKRVAVIESRFRAHAAENGIPSWLMLDMEALAGACRQAVAAARLTLQDIDDHVPLPTTALRNLVAEWDR